MIRLTVATILFTFFAAPVSAITLEWIEQLGTLRSDTSEGVSVDSLGNVFISGSTWGNLGGPNVGSGDAFVSKYDASGNLLWIEQLGSPRYEFSTGVSADNLGNVFISGYTEGDLGEPYSNGGPNAFVSKYDTSGNLLWTKELLTGSFDNDRGGISTDGLGNVFISGFGTSWVLGGPNGGFYDAFVSKYDASGNLLWTERIGSSRDDYSSGVSADSLGNVFVSGSTSGDLGGPIATSPGAFVSKYDESGNLLWTEQLGSSSFEGVSADGLGNVFISGFTSGDLGGPNAGSRDAFVSKFDGSGNLLWTEQFGSPSSEESLGVSADGLGNVFVSGLTWGDLGGPNAGSRDAFVSKIDGLGNLLWTEQLGSSGNDKSFGVSADSLGNVYISGETDGDLGGLNAGRVDAFVAKFSETRIPEPTSLTLLLFGTFVGQNAPRRGLR